MTDPTRAGALERARSALIGWTAPALNTAPVGARRMTSAHFKTWERDVFARQSVKAQLTLMSESLF